jgi:hypothetical protein
MISTNCAIGVDAAGAGVHSVEEGAVVAVVVLPRKCKLDVINSSADGCCADIPSNTIPPSFNLCRLYGCAVGIAGTVELLFLLCWVVILVKPLPTNEFA